MKTLLENKSIKTLQYRIEKNKLADIVSDFFCINDNLENDDFMLFKFDQESKMETLNKLRQLMEKDSDAYFPIEVYLGDDTKNNDSYKGLREVYNVGKSEINKLQNAGLINNDMYEPYFDDGTFFISFNILKVYELFQLASTDETFQNTLDEIEFQIKEMEKYASYMKGKI
jgi:hypothetical protein